MTEPSNIEALSKMTVPELLAFLSIAVSASEPIETLTVPAFVLGRILESHERQRKVIAVVEESLAADDRLRHVLELDRNRRNR
jgi:hypothetical protein